MRSLRVCGGIKGAFSFLFHAWQIPVFHVLVAKQLTAALWKSIKQYNL